MKQNKKARDIAVVQLGLQTLERPLPYPWPCGQGRIHYDDQVYGGKMERKEKQTEQFGHYEKRQTWRHEDCEEQPDVSSVSCHLRPR